VAIGVGISLFFSSECPPDSRLVALEPECQPDSALLTGYVVYRAERRRSAVMRLVLAAAVALEQLSPIPLELLPGNTMLPVAEQAKSGGGR
jgi:hypothetical protein